MTSTEAYRESGVGKRHPISSHYADGYRNGTKAVTDNPHHRDWYAAMAWAAARNRPGYADWPPYRAYQLGFARGARQAV